MTPQQALAATRRAVNGAGEEIFIHRAGVSPDTSTMARPMGQATERLVGDVTQSVQKLIVLVDNLGSLLPLTKNDSVVKRGKTLAIEDIDDDTRRIGGVLIALELTVCG